MANIIARIQAATGKDTTFASTVSATFAGNNTAGNAILLAWEGDVGAANSANTPTDTAGNKYERILSNSLTATFNLEMWICWNCKFKAGNVVTVTDTIGGSDGILIVEEWQGLGTLNVNDGSTSAQDNTGLSNAPNSGAITTKGEFDLIWCAAAIALGANDLGAGAGFSNLTQNSTTFSNLGICSKVISVAGSNSGAFTSSAVGSWVCGVVAIRQRFTQKFEHTLRPRPFAPGVNRFKNKVIKD